MDFKEFQAVLMAGGIGQSLYPLTESIPKPLLPIINRPMLSFQLEMLDRSGISEIIVIINTTVAEKVSEFIKGFKSKATITVIAVDPNLDTAEALRKAKDKIKTDFFVVSGDLVTNVFLHYLADIHRARDAAATILLKHAPKEEKDKKEPSKARPEDQRQEFIGLDAKEKNRILFYQSASDIEGEFKISKALLKRYPHTILHSDLQDHHLYLFSHSVLNVLEDKKEIASIQGELIPYLIKLQFSVRAKKYFRSRSSVESLVSKVNHVHEPAGPVLDKKVRTNSVNSVSGSSSSSSSSAYSVLASDGEPSKDELKSGGCYAYVALPNAYCLRARDLQNYQQICLQLASEVHEYMPWQPVSKDNYIRQISESSPHAQLGNNCVFGEGVKVGEKSSVKKSVVGRHCIIGANCRISNSVIMDNVVIEDGSTISNTIIAIGAQIKTKSNLLNCTIGSSYVVAPNTTSKNETLSKGDF